MEIRAEICVSLQEAINISLEALKVVSGYQVAVLIQPIVNRLEWICRENGFPD